MKPSDIRAMSEDEMKDELLKLKKEQFNLRFQRASGQLENTARMRSGASRHRPYPDDCPRQAGRSRVRVGVKEERNAKDEFCRAPSFPTKTTRLVVVKVERRFTHPLFKKTVRRSKNYKAHDENNAKKVGDMVSIQESRPISKDKNWVVVDV